MKKKKIVKMKVYTINIKIFKIYLKNKKKINENIYFIVNYRKKL
jgi:hypothetical protein